MAKEPDPGGIKSKGILPGVSRWLRTLVALSFLSQAGLVVPALAASDLRPANDMVYTFQLSAQQVAAIPGRFVSVKK